MMRMIKKMLKKRIGCEEAGFGPGIFIFFIFLFFAKENRLLKANWGEVNGLSSSAWTIFLPMGLFASR